MRKRAVLASVVGSATVLVVGWQAGAGAAHNEAAMAAASSTRTSTNSTLASGPTASSTPGPSPSASPSAAPSAAPSGSPTPKPSAKAPAPSSGVNGTFVGSTVDTFFGPMQVEAVVTHSKITDVKVLQETNQGGRSVEISNYAVPILRSEVLSAQSANVSSVGGATYTSEGYLTSLQSALDKAKV